MVCNGSIIGNGAGGADCACFNDLPDPDGGFISLEDKVYDLQLRTVTISDPIRFPEDSNCKLINGTIIYEGAGVLFDTPEMGSRVKRISDIFAIFTGGGTLFDITSTTPQGALVIDNFAALSPGSVGSVNGGVFSITTSRFITIGTGLTLSNLSITNIAGLLMTGTNQSTTFISWEGTTQGDIDIVSYAPTIQGNEIAINFDSGTSFNNVTAHGCTIGLSGSATIDNVFEAGSLDQTEIGFKFTGNTNISDSTVSARIGFQNNTTETVIDQTGVPVRINGTYVDGFQERTSYTSDGKIISESPESITADITAYISIEPVTGVNILMGCYITHTQSETYEVTYTNGTNIINRVGHGLANDTSIRLSTDGTLPAEIREDQFYWIVNTAADTFQVSNTKGGAVHTFTDDGSGTHYYALGEYIEYSEITTSPSSNSPGNLTIGAKIDYSSGDEIEVFVDNHDTTSNILGTNINVVLGKG